MVAISAADGLTVVERCMARIDHETVERSERERAANAAEERRKYLYARLFQHVTPTRDVAGLRTESQASDMFLRARGENLLQIAILRVAVDNRWGSVVTAFIKLWDGEHPIAGTVQELWNLTLTTGRSAV